MTPERRVALRQLEKLLGYDFRDVLLLNQALTHRSYVHEKPQVSSGHNERLEFLGDAVLQLCLSVLLMGRFRDFKEGALSRLRASLVNEKSLAALAKTFSLGEYILLGRGEELSAGRTKSSLLADAFEAVLAAIFIDGGYERAYAFVVATFSPLLEGEGLTPFHDYKTTLQEESIRRFRAMPRYSLIAEYGPEHDRIFEVKIEIGTCMLATGKGGNKKEAEQEAARRALALIQGGGVEGGR